MNYKLLTLIFNLVSAIPLIMENVRDLAPIGGVLPFDKPVAETVDFSNQFQAITHNLQLQDLEKPPAYSPIEQPPTYVQDTEFSLLKGTANKEVFSKLSKTDLETLFNSPRFSQFSLENQFEIQARHDNVPEAVVNAMFQRADFRPRTGSGATIDAHTSLAEAATKFKAMDDAEFDKAFDQAIEFNLGDAYLAESNIRFSLNELQQPGITTKAITLCIDRLSKDQLIDIIGAKAFTTLPSQARTEILQSFADDAKFTSNLAAFKTFKTASDASALLKSMSWAETSRILLSPDFQTYPRDLQDAVMETLFPEPRGKVDPVLSRQVDAFNGQFPQTPTQQIIEIFKKWSSNTASFAIEKYEKIQQAFAKYYDYFKTNGILPANFHLSWLRLPILMPDFYTTKEIEVFFAKLSDTTLNSEGLKAQVLNAPSFVRKMCSEEKLYRWRVARIAQTSDRNTISQIMDTMTIPQLERFAKGNLTPLERDIFLGITRAN